MNLLSFSCFYVVFSTLYMLFFIIDFEKICTRLCISLKNYVLTTVSLQCLYLSLDLVTYSKYH